MPTVQVPCPARERRDSVLVVLAEDDLRRLVTRVLERAGFRVEGCRTSRRAREYPSGTFACVVLKPMLVDGSGILLALQLRTASSETAFLFISGGCSIEIPPEIPKARFLQMPFAIRKLVAMVTELTEHRREMAASTREGPRGDGRRASAEHHSWRSRTPARGW